MHINEPRQHEGSTSIKVTLGPTRMRPDLGDAVTADNDPGVIYHSVGQHCSGMTDHNVGDRSVRGQRCHPQSLSPALDCDVYAS